MTQPDRTAYPGLIYDVGMHNGEDTDFYLRKGFRVIGFEADPDLVRHCSTRFSDALSHGELVIIEGAIVDEAALCGGRRTVTFYKNLDASVWGTAELSWKERNDRLGTRSRAIEVPAVDFGECLARFGVPYYLKIDIEGADLVCLRALLRCAGRPAYLSMESEKVSFARLVQEVRLLGKLGYTRFQVVQQSTVASQAVPEPPREGRFVQHKFPYGASGLFGRELPGRWMPPVVVLARYAGIFLLYGLFGDRALLRRFHKTHSFLARLERALGRNIPGWYDTHARHSSANDERATTVDGGTRNRV